MIQTDPTTLVCRHTPGPWECRPLNTGCHAGTIPVVTPDYGKNLGSGQLIASVCGRAGVQEETARLIACAPGLLDVAKKAMLFMEDCFEVQPPDDHEIEIYNALRGAVAGAGGFAQETHWWQGPCICDCCQHRWQGVVEIHISRMSPEYGFECPNCHEMKGGPA